MVEAGLLPGVTEGGVNVAVTFDGKPETVKTMAPANPLALPGVTVIEVEADMPENDIFVDYYELLRVSPAAEITGGEVWNAFTIEL